MTSAWTPTARHPGTLADVSWQKNAAATSARAPGPAGVHGLPPPLPPPGKPGSIRHLFDCDAFSDRISPGSWYNPRSSKNTVSGPHHGRQNAILSWLRTNSQDTC
jgi:hypothetical protein